MNRKMVTLGLLMALGVFGPVAAHSDDKWEASGESVSDDNSSTRNQLVLGGKQTSLQRTR